MTLRTLTYALAALVFFVSGNAFAVERMAVLELSGDALPIEQRMALADSVRAGVVLALPGDVQVMTRENMEVMLQDMGLDESCMAEGSCEVDTARNLNADYVLSGTITQFGDQLVVSIKFHEVHSARLLASEQVRGADALALLNELPKASAELVSVLGRPAAPPTAQSTMQCPEGYAPTADGCVQSPECSIGKTLTASGLQCCWPGQAWAADTQECIGPVRGSASHWQQTSQDYAAAVNALSSRSQSAQVRALCDTGDEILGYWSTPTREFQGYVMKAKAYRLDTVAVGQAQVVADTQRAYDAYLKDKKRARNSTITGSVTALVGIGAMFGSMPFLEDSDTMAAGFGILGGGSALLLAGGLGAGLTEPASGDADADDVEREKRNLEAARRKAAEAHAEADAFLNAE